MVSQYFFCAHEHIFAYIFHLNYVLLKVQSCTSFPSAKSVKFAKSLCVWIFAVRNLDTLACICLSEVRIYTKKKKNAGHPPFTIDCFSKIQDQIYWIRFFFIKYDVNVQNDDF